MSRVECRLAGYGGQGVVLAGVILGYAAILEGKNAAQTQSYGPEARGGAARSDVVISDEDIDCLLVSRPDILLAMSQEALDKYIGGLSNNGFILYDSDLVKDISSAQKFIHVGLPGTRYAVERFGNKLMANMIMLGALAGWTGLVSESALKQSAEAFVPANLMSANLAALAFGYSLGLKLKEDNGLKGALCYGACKHSVR